ncbi:MAG: sodium:alanine symporter family protein [Bacillota bacterium]|uniref:Alanine or glycine:cation symporter, AGCS family n=1 Tax=[Clostridium] aminophilum TaxID=1526 RepID=A0A1I6J504_9FIRM|nr:sodium:alanine symporter family protein [[Clostridium] aminophilum]MCR4629281.1 sodium:alanine symporter family protein [Clostridium sp.]MDT3844088.1 sodium:alanine symporter family protein [Bacillota bacterium]SFR74084.1 alanine or glycine:cation symporter, AGCS family [[Clostridium] aminophilum]
MDKLNDIVVLVNDFVWNNILLYVLVGTGIFFTIRTGFVQIRRFPQAWHRVFGGFSLNGEKAGKDGMSSFQALSTAIAAQVGTGNIAGCATALVSGGPGAIFWMWIAAFFGMATIYGEAILAQKTRVRDDDGNITGGPVYYIREAFPGGFGKFLGGFFSVAIICALGFMGNMVQSNSISDAFYTAFGAPKFAVGIAIAVIAAFIFLGGIGRIASFTEKVVPMMAALYLIGSVIVLAINFRNLPGAVASIFIGAFSPKAVGGAVAGMTIRMAMRFGVARGLFSNEAGMGSTPHAHAMAKVKHPQEQGETAMVGVFLDTFIVLTVTALVILSSGVLDGMISNGVSGTPVAQSAFGTAFGGFGSVFVALCLLFFAFSTIIGWYFFAAANVTQLFGSRAVKPFSVIVVACIFLGSLLKVDLVWNLSDLFNGLMVLPNLVALIALNAVVARAARGKRIERNLKEDVPVVQRPVAE